MDSNEDGRFNEMKQSFLASAIADIATYIQLADTKVSIIMGALVALIAGTMACYEPIADIISRVKPCSWIGNCLVIFSVLCIGNIIAAFVYGILTIRGHVSIIDYQSKWYLSKSTQEYSFDAYKQDIISMDDKDIIENMAAELYKLNDINRQKARTMKCTIRCFAVALSTAGILGMLLLFSIM